MSIFRFTAHDSDPKLQKFLDNHTPVESLVTLKVGAQVMLLKNLNVSLIAVQQTMLARRLVVSVNVIILCAIPCNQDRKFVVFHQGI